jgi:hypothetical protein
MFFKSLTLLVSVLVAVQASLLTFVLEPDETSCYYVLTDRPKTSVGFYFAVQSGGSFDVDYHIKGPDGVIIAQEEKQRQGDWVFKAETVGEYEFCFSNEMSTFAEKVVDFEISFENDFKAHIDLGKSQDLRIDGVVKSVDHINSQVNNVLKSLQYYKTRNHRNHATVKSTESRIFYFSIYELLLCVGMAILQVSVVQLFFKDSRKQLV